MTLTQLRQMKHLDLLMILEIIVMLYISQINLSRTQYTNMGNLTFCGVVNSS